MWPIINKLFIWRETCFFDGSELKKQAAIPYCVSKELSIEILFLHTRGETICNCLAAVKRDPRFEDRCLLTGQFRAPKLPIINCVLPHGPSVMSSAGPVGTRTPDRDRGASLFYSQFAVWNSGRGARRCNLGSEGRSKQPHMPHTPCCLLKVSRALFLVLNRRRGRLIARRHTLRSGGCGWHRSEISCSIHSSSCLTAEAKLNPWADLSLLNFAQLSFDLT